jgi:UDP-glucuronate 4-epimerase
MDILVTGGAGFIGSNFLAKFCTDQKNKITVVDELNSLLYADTYKRNRIENLAKFENIEFYQADICNLPDSITERKFDIIVNFAALPGQLLSWDEIDKYSHSNLVGVGTLLQRLVVGNETKFIQLSTSSVYGKMAEGDEQSPCIPYSPYGVTKKAAEDLIIAFANNFQIDYLIFRPFSVFGPGQRPDMAVHKFLHKIKNGIPIEIYGDGLQSRSMTSVHQIVNALVNAVNSKSAERQDRIFNLAANNSISALELINLCEKVVGKKAIKVHIPKPPGDQLKTKGNSLKAVEEFDFESRIDILEVIKQQFESMKHAGI